MDRNVSFWLSHLYRRRSGRAMEVRSSGPYRYDMDCDRSCHCDRNWHYGLSLKQWHQGKYRNQPKVKNVSLAAQVILVSCPRMAAPLESSKPTNSVKWDIGRFCPLPPSTVE